MSANATTLDFYVEGTDLTPKAALALNLTTLTCMVTNMVSSNAIASQKSFTDAHDLLKNVLSATAATNQFNAVYTKWSFDKRKGPAYSAMKAASAICKSLDKGTLELSVADKHYADNFTAELLKKDGVKLELQRASVERILLRRIAKVKAILALPPKDQAVAIEQKRQRMLPTNRPCRFFPKGTCRNGDNCPYVHADAPAPAPAIADAPAAPAAVFDATTCCTRGSNCRTAGCTRIHNWTA